jgi:hypothetical protein
MNWYLLNIPLCAALATAVLAPIMVVISRDSTHQDNAPVSAAAGHALVPAPATFAAGASPRPQVRVLENVS